MAAKVINFLDYKTNKNGDLSSNSIINIPHKEAILALLSKEKLTKKECATLFQYYQKLGLYTDRLIEQREDVSHHMKLLDAIVVKFRSEYYRQRTV